MQGKTGFQAFTPWTNFLPKYAERMEPDRAMMHAALACLAGQPTFLATEARKQRSANGLGNLIREAAREAGLVNKSAHGLRKTRAVELADAGATTKQISAWTGHQTLKEVEHYTRAANRRRAVMGLPPIDIAVVQTDFEPAIGDEA